MKIKEKTNHRHLPWRGPLTTILCFWLGGALLTASHSIYVAGKIESGDVEPSVLVSFLDCAGILLIATPFAITTWWIVTLISKAISVAWKFGHRHFNSHASVVVLLFSTAAATGATLRPSPVAPSGFVDTESVTNAAIRAEALADARTFSGSITLDATVSNAVEVAFGIADPATGALAPGEESFAVGWDGGRWFFASATDWIESSEIAEPARRTLSFSMRVPAAGKPRDLSISAAGAGSAFTELAADTPEWLFSRSWNAVRLTTRGIGPTGESVSVHFATDPGALILR